MKEKLAKPDTAAILRGLKDFQLATVEHVFERLYTDSDCTRRFLVADEVGLGKTLVARGVIAKTIDHLWNQTQRIDVVYVCSNTDIARQNINRLNVLGCDEFALSSRITLLPLEKAVADGGSELPSNSGRVNFVSFTPGTSFDLKRSGGVARERALLYWMLKDAWQLNKPIHSRPFEGTSSKKGFQYDLNLVDPDAGWFTIHQAMRNAFVDAVERQPFLKTEYDRLVAAMPPRKEVAAEIRSQCLAWIGCLRRLLAETCLHWLEPDLIILDEFQRFKHLMAGDGDDATEAAELADHLFRYKDASTEARVLLLSATPYKMYTTSAESADDDHYEDFRLTLKFLIDDEEKRTAFQSTLTRYREELFRVAEHGPEALLQVKSELESLLRSVMVRTERLAIESNRDGMLIEKDMQGVELREADVKQYLALQRIAGQLGHGDMLEYWKSAPYLMNFMEHYDVKRRLDSDMEIQVDSSLAKAFRSLADGLLSRETIEQYGKLDPGNARLRALAEDTVEREAWRLLWIPPSMPYYQGGGAYVADSLKGYTKRLVFSCWKVVPKAIASVLSYEAERCMMRQYRKKSKNTAEARKKRRGLLRFSFSKGRPSGMTALGLLYPCRTLAIGIDPKNMLKQGGATKSDALDMAGTQIKSLLDPVLSGLGKHGSTESSEGHDDRWYWAAPLMLDLHYQHEQTMSWLSSDMLPEVWSGDSLSGDAESADGWRKHVDQFRHIAENQSELGNPPDDLVNVLATIALAAPGVVAMRSLSRIVDLASRSDALDDEQTTPDVASYAAPMGHAFLTLFNIPEVMSLVRDPSKETPYWQSVLAYALDGNLQSTVDEYVHVLVESLGLPGKPFDKFASQIVKEVSDALSLRTTRSQADMFNSDGRRLKTEEPLRIRNRFAISFGDQTRDDDGEKTRPSQVRTAFNSPFWPFVLASTSVGQEGLDFHPYCHAVVHWNLPSNPVDLEQREGRVHRYKGHALRKNIAEQFLANAIDGSNSDPWQIMFDAARAGRPDDHNDLYPFWISPSGSAKIERHLPLISHSREVVQRLNLARSLVLYRMVFGQNRQEDLVNYLRSRLDETQISELVDLCRIDLSPPPRQPKSPERKTK